MTRQVIHEAYPAGFYFKYRLLFIQPECMAVFPVEPNWLPVCNRVGEKPTWFLFVRFVCLISLNVENPISMDGLQFTHTNKVRPFPYENSNIAFAQACA